MKKILTACSLVLLFVSLSYAEDTFVEKDPVRILITGSLSPQGMERIGKPISTLRSAEIKQKHAASIGETLRNEAGISGTNFGPGASRPVIRGQSKERVRVLENGLENGDASAASDDHAVTNDPLSTKRIDILRGPSTLMFGGQAIGGVVNVIDDSIAEEGIGEDLTGELHIVAGDSATDEFSGSTVLKGQAGSLNWYLSGFSRNTNDIDIPGYAESRVLRESEEHEHDEDHEEEEDEHEEDEHHDEEETKGKLENSDLESYGVKAGLSHVWNNGFFGLAVKGIGSEYGIPGGHFHAEEEHDEHDEHEEEEHEEEEHEEENVRIDLEQVRLESRGAFHLHHGLLDSVRYGFSYSDYEHKELEGTSVGTVYDRDTVEGRLLFAHHHEGLLEGGFGLQVNYEDLSVRGAEAFIPSSETFSPAIFFIEDLAIEDNVIWQIGGRYEHSNVDPLGMSSESFNVFSASTGLIWHTAQKDYSAALNLSYAERSPNVSELFADGAHIASQTYELGDSDLDKEASIGGELILRKLKGSTRGAFTAFIQNYSDYINLAATGMEMEGFSVFEYENVDARFWGFEGELEQDLYSNAGHLLTLNAGFDLVRARDTDNSENLPRITPQRTKVGLDYSYNNFSAYVDAIIVEKQDKLAEFELPTDSYTLLNAGTNVHLHTDSAYSFDLFLRATNLTDEEARVHSSFLKDLAPLRGRAFFAGITAYF